jgi:hypothetical protein
MARFGIYCALKYIHDRAVRQGQQHARIQKCVHCTEVGTERLNNFEKINPPRSQFCIAQSYMDRPGTGLGLDLSILNDSMISCHHGPPDEVDNIYLIQESILDFQSRNL